MENVKELVKEIKDNLSQKSSSQKDEGKVMRAMLNDRDYKVDVYNKDGIVGEYCPAEDARTMMASVVSSTTKINVEEATKLMDSYEFKKAEANTFINVGKEFVNTYLETGRKLPLGGRAESNVSISLKEVKATERPFPVQIGVNEDGSKMYGRGLAPVEAHKSIKVHGPCPEWLTGEKK